MTRVLLALLLVCAGVPACGQDAVGDEAAIRTILAGQVEAWNQGDIPAFMQGYEDSPQTTFIGSAVRRGYESILQRYRTAYSTREQMGKLSFSNIDVRLLPGPCGSADYALVTGNFHLDRKQQGAASKNDGVFSLVWRKGSNGWKIVLDHSS